MNDVFNNDSMRHSSRFPAHPILYPQAPSHKDRIGNQELCGSGVHMATQLAVDCNLVQFLTTQRCPKGWRNEALPQGLLQVLNYKNLSPIQNLQGSSGGRTVRFPLSLELRSMLP